MNCPSTFPLPIRPCAGPFPSFSRCLPGFLFDRDPVLVHGKPVLEPLQRGVEGPRDADVACPAEDVFEVALELEHVPEVFCARKSQATVHLRRNVLITHLLPQRFREGLCHLRAGQMLAGEADGFP